ncbi:bifunctional phosphopantothenoylcysteine decarboxylase/phosphopantothenate--cysteine ligase CoaBC [Rickettsiales bacterium]|nr:bifunctional phosphopantothenoylcysteine decarboxylase/phosphopantothenate--cysteine ligase CoaBC [Rickettsiales bacterium]MDB2550359.1 bifunctional phosphopantothenoylcysteine decarboxylase/phosphopantothenate--cysteine ligase CoaBC [Rickettsiales bacterium]
MSQKILLIITASIACYKSLELIRLFRKNNYKIEVILTKEAEKFITPLLVSSILGDEIKSDLFNPDDKDSMDHINLSRNNDLILIAPASANFIAKMANGIADDLASAVILASNKKIFLAPAMNVQMWENNINQDNLNKLTNNNISIIEPQKDILACGEYGSGKMAQITDIFDNIEDFFDNKNKFHGKKIIITAGATYEAIDPVRFIGNYSSGKQGIAIAEIMYQMGGDVILIASNITEKINLPGKNIIRTRNTDQMLQAVENNIKNTDIYISAAAICDFKPKNYSQIKIKKHQNINNIELELNIDILQNIANHQNRPKIVIGFAAESNDLIENAINKAKRKNCDLIIANDIQNGDIFGSNQNEIAIVDKNKIIAKISKDSKKNIAKEIIKWIKI